MTKKNRFDSIHFKKYFIDVKNTIKKIKEKKKPEKVCEFCNLVYEKSLQINNKIQILLQK